MVLLFYWILDYTVCKSAIFSAIKPALNRLTNWHTPEHVLFVFKYCWKYKKMGHQHQFTNKYDTQRYQARTKSGLNTFIACIFFNKYAYFVNMVIMTATETHLLCDRIAVFYYSFSDRHHGHQFVSVLPLPLRTLRDDPHSGHIYDLAVRTLSCFMADNV